MAGLTAYETLMPLIPALPLAAAVLAIALGMFGETTRRFAHVPVIVALVLACFASLAVLYRLNLEPVINLPSEPGGPVGVFEKIIPLWIWADIPQALTLGAHSYDFRIEVVLRADTLTAAMLAMVTFVASLVAIYSSSYMEGDEGYARFFAYFGLFVFSMTMLVSVSNFLLLFVFWEAVGLCSYLLIGFWFSKPEASEAGKKAFLVNRVGDFGFTLAIFLIWITYGSLNFHDTAPPTVDGSLIPASQMGVLGHARLTALEAGGRAETGGYVGGALGTAICLLLLVGACGKSAQFPLHVWLPDAMEGPTPVSALIHAATMVTAGVYMIARCTPLFMVSPEAQLTVAMIGGFTALLGALIALTQYDLKRVLAYSTVSQLGFMFLGLGAGTFSGITAGMFHLYTHAFFKALLFLGAGSVMHAMGNVIDMRRFGGLKDLMPWTCGTFLIGSLALAGVFPLSGFWSKDQVLASIHDRVHDYELAYERVSGGPGHDAHSSHGSHAPAAHSATPGGFAATHSIGGAVVETNPLLAADRMKKLPGQAEFADYRDHPLGRLSATQLWYYGGVYEFLYWLGMFTAFLTAFYTFRAYFMTFFGEKRIPHEAGDHAHEAPWAMVSPLVVLAVCSCVVGLLLSPGFGAFLEHSYTLGRGAITATKPLGATTHFDVALISTVCAVAGVALAAYLYNGHRREVETLKAFFNFEWSGRTAPGTYFATPYELSYHKFFFDEIYNFLFVWPLRLLASLSYLFDRLVIDGLVNFVGSLPPAMGWVLRSLQTGLVPYYALVMILGLVAILAARALLAG